MCRRLRLVATWTASTGVDIVLGVRLNMVAIYIFPSLSDREDFVLEKAAEWHVGRRDQGRPVAKLCGCVLTFGLPNLDISRQPDSHLSFGSLLPNAQDMYSLRSLV